MHWNDFKYLKWDKRNWPILTPSQGKTWDNYSVITPSVIKKDDKFLMFYTGQGYNSNWGIGLAESLDLINWKRLLDKPLIQCSENQCFSAIDGVSVMFNEKAFLFFESKEIRDTIIKKTIKGLIPGSIYLSLIRFKCFINDMVGKSIAVQHAKTRKIYFIESEMLYKWNTEGAKVVFTYEDTGWDCDGVFSPRIFRFKNKFYLVYGGSNGSKINTGIAVSLDFYNWKRISSEPILKHGNKGDWDENHALIVDIIELEDGFVGFYEGEDRWNKYRIGLAYSKDLVSWKKFEGNPILDSGSKGSFDERMVCSPHVIVKNNEYFLFYTAHNRYMQGCCGLAIGKSNS